MTALFAQNHESPSQSLTQSLSAILLHAHYRQPSSLLSKRSSQSSNRVSMPASNTSCTLPTAMPLPQEREEGNHEYKFTLANIAPHTLTHRVSQLRWRLQESMTLGYQLDSQWNSVYESSILPSNDIENQRPLQVSNRLQHNATNNNSSAQTCFIDRHVISNATEGNKSQIDREEELPTNKLCARAYYHIGVDDDGTPRGLSVCDLRASLDTLQLMAEMASCEVSLQQVQQGLDGLVAEVVFHRALPQAIEAVASRVWTEGSAHSGKTTLLSVLQVPRIEVCQNKKRGMASTLSSCLDNGHGSARMRMCTHQHELISGHTSSISHCDMFFDENGALLTSDADDYAMELDTETENHQPLAAHTIVTLFDSPGHSKYFKTTVSGFACRQPQMILHCLEAADACSTWDKNCQDWTSACCLGLRNCTVPMAIVLTKSDLVCKSISDLECQFQDHLSNQMSLRFLHSVDDVDAFVTDFSTTASTTTSRHLVPVIVTSSVTGAGLLALRRLLFQSNKWICPSVSIAENSHPQTDNIATAPTNVRIWRSLPLTSGLLETTNEDEESTAAMFSAALNDDQKKCQKRISQTSLQMLCSQQVFWGHVDTGILQLNDKLWFGPSNVGEWFSVTVDSIRVHNVSVQRAIAGQLMTCCLTVCPQHAMCVLNRSHCGSVLTNRCSLVPARLEFEVDLNMCDASLDSRALELLAVSQQLVAHCGAVRQVVEVISIQQRHARAHTTTPMRCKLRFLYSSEVIFRGQTVLLRDERIRAIGQCV